MSGTTPSHFRSTKMRFQRQPERRQNTAALAFVFGRGHPLIGLRGRL